MRTAQAFTSTHGNSRSAQFQPARGGEYSGGADTSRVDRALATQLDDQPAPAWCLLVLRTERPTSERGVSFAPREAHRLGHETLLCPNQRLQLCAICGTHRGQHRGSATIRPSLRISSNTPETARSGIHWPCGHRDPDSNRGHHDSQTVVRNARTRAKRLQKAGCRERGRGRARCRNDREAEERRCGLGAAAARP